MLGVVRLRRRLKFVRNVLQILSQLPQHVGADVAAQDNFAVGSYSDNQVRHLKAYLLQPQADKDISLGERFRGFGRHLPSVDLMASLRPGRGADGWQSADLSLVRPAQDPGGAFCFRHGNCRLWGRVEAFT